MKIVEEINWQEATEDQEKEWVSESKRLFGLMESIAHDSGVYGAVLVPTDEGLVLFVPASMESVLQSITDDLAEDLESKDLKVIFMTPPEEN